MSTEIYRLEYRRPVPHNMALGGVLEHHDALGRVVVNGQVKAFKDDHGAVWAVQLSDGGTALEMPRVPGNRHHVVNGDVLREEVEKVAGIDQPVQALLDDPEERVERREVRQVGNRYCHDATLLPRRRATRNASWDLCVPPSAGGPG